MAHPAPHSAERSATIAARAIGHAQAAQDADREEEDGTQNSAASEAPLQVAHPTDGTAARLARYHDCVGVRRLLGLLLDDHMMLRRR